tara:strand:- start:829 stop:1011 length:183 start_codon:yes stop_codon:yes gene_type:complete
VKNGNTGALEDGELDNSIRTLSSSAVIKVSSVFTRNKSFVEVSLEDVWFSAEFWFCVGKL